MTRPLAGLDDIDWSRRYDAYGTAEETPRRLRALTHPLEATRRQALYDLYGALWHQGTVDDVTAAAVPFLAALVISPDTDAGTRTEVALLLAPIASADSFVLGGEITGWRAAWGRGADDQTPPRDVAEDCRAAVAAATAGWWRSALIDAVRPGAVAVAAATASTLPTAAHSVLREWSSAPDRRIAIAVAITDDLARGADPADRLHEAGTLDVESAELVASLADLPLGVLAVQVVFELCSSVAADSRS